MTKPEYFMSKLKCVASWSEVKAELDADHTVYDYYLDFDAKDAAWGPFCEYTVIYIVEVD